MMRSVLFALFLAVWLPAAQAAMLELTDGSVVSGEIVALVDGVYTVQTESLGKVRVKESQVKAIRYGSPSPTQQDHVEQLQSLQRGIIMDQQMMERVMQLQSDPQIQAVLSDPEIVSAISSGDLNALMQNPKFMELMQHPALKSMTNEILGQ